MQRWSYTLVEYSVFVGNRKVGNTHDLKKGSPRLQLNKDPWLGASVATTRLATHADESSLVPMKSRGSIGNIWPPIWNASECGVEQDNIA
jgi:hypothetical protein